MSLTHDKPTWDTHALELRFAERLSARGVELDGDTEATVLAAFRETLADPALTEAVPWSPDEEEEIRAGLEAAHQDILAGNYIDVSELRAYLQARHEGSTHEEFMARRGRRP